MKIAVNRRYGGFALSPEVIEELLRLGHYGFLNNEDFNIKSDNPNAYRGHPNLIAAIEKVGLAKASGKHSRIEIVNIPDEVCWEVSANAGYEVIDEVHRSW